MIIYIDFLDHMKKNYSHQQIQLRKQALGYSHMTNATISFSNHILQSGKENSFLTMRNYRTVSKVIHLTIWLF